VWVSFDGLDEAREWVRAQVLCERHFGKPLHVFEMEAEMDLEREEAARRWEEKSAERKRLREERKRQREATRAE
jgi:hypothetical protein